ncbi:hypothetical protein, partial [Chromatium okenii]|uniref:hypothetical protein n=1 Tax=Chromatium okenii TaxID=61644 RepID=UPI0026EB7DF1
MNNTAQAWEIARDIAAHQGTGSKEWYGLAHLILTLPARIEVIEEPIDDGEPCQLTNSQVKRLIAQLDDAQLSERIEPTVEENEMNEL